MGLSATTSYRAETTPITFASYLKQIEDAKTQSPFNTAMADGNRFSDVNRVDQRTLSNTMMDDLAGRNPSLANALLSQATDKNNLASASLIGSQKGMNPALAARTILENNARQNQVAAGQGASSAIQERYANEMGLNTVLANTRGQDITQAKDVADTQTARIGALGGLQNTVDANRIHNDLGVQDINAKIAIGNTAGSNQLAGSLIGAAGQIGGAYAGNSKPKDPTPTMPTGGDQYGGPQSGNPDDPNFSGTAGYTGGGGEGGDSGGSSGGENYAAKGGKVPGRAIVKGDSPVNDTVPAMLSPGEVVLKRTVAKDGDKAKSFVEALKKQGKGGEIPNRNPAGYAKVLQSHKALHDRLAYLERLCYGGAVR